jgi:glycerol-3-phosphate dehydrogenase
VLELERADPGLSAPLVPGLPYRRSEAIYAVRSEMATTLDDVLSRRTRARLLGRDLTAAAAESVARLIAPELGWDEARIGREVSDLRAALVHERTTADLPEQALDESIGA